MKIIVSLTTIPSRIRFIEPVMQSLIRQTLPPDEIHLHLPNWCVKENAGYEIPSFLASYESVRIRVSDLDFGSANKWLGPIQYLNDEVDTALIIVDDDCEYQKDTIELLLAKIRQNPSQCYCLTGGILPRFPQVLRKFGVSSTPLVDTLTIIENNSQDIEVDTIQGFSMFVVLPHWFQDVDFSIFEVEGTRSLSDDILISGLLEYLNIPRLQLGPYKLPMILPQSQLNALHSDENRFVKMTLEAVTFMKQSFGIWGDVSCAS